MVRDFQPDTSLTMDAHDAYWGGRPPIKTLRLVEVPEVAARVNGLLAGDYQFACDIPPDQIGVVQQHAGFEVQGGPILNHRISTFDIHHPQLRDPRVRQAMSHAIDRQAIIDGLWAGRSRVPPGMQWEFFGDMFIADFRAPEYDPAKARQLLKEAGYKGDPIPYRLLNNYYINQVSTSQILVEMWRQVGLNVQISHEGELDADPRQIQPARRARLVGGRDVQRPGGLDRVQFRTERRRAAGRRI